MPVEHKRRITWRDPLGTEPEIEPWRTDLVLPSFFLSAATLILATINPTYYGFAPHLIETYVVVLLCIAVTGWGVYKGRLDGVLLGSGLMLLLIALCLTTQPTRLGISTNTVWPLRSALFMLVAGSWAFLMRPPMWARRAMMAISIPVVVVIACAGGPTLTATISNALRLNGSTSFSTPIPANNFSPYWLAVDSHGTLYATAASGGYIWVFDPSGVPLGTIRPALAPEAGSADPGILPIGFPSPTAIPTPGANGIGVTYTAPIPFCGIATDHMDNLYMIDPYTNQLVRMSREGKVTKRFALPEKFAGARGCLATDAEHIYVSSGFGSVFIMDYEARIEKEVKLDYQPFGVAPDGKGKLLVLGPNELGRIDIATGAKEVAPPPPQASAARVRYQTILATNDGEILGADLANSRVVRIDPDTGDLLGTIGNAGSIITGYSPGQFQSLGGLAQDKTGRVYVADWQLGVIERFTPQGELEAVLWVPGEVQPPIILEEE